MAARPSGACATMLTGQTSVSFLASTGSETTSGVISTRMNMAVSRRSQSSAREEGGEALRHAARILDLQQVGSSREDERPGVREPLKNALVDLTVGGKADSGVGVRAHDREDRLLDATGVFSCKLPLPDGGKFSREERVRVGGGLLERPWELSLDGVAIVLAAHAPQEGIDGPGPVTSFVYRHGRPERLNERCATGNAEQGGVQKGKRRDGVWSVEGELNADN